MKKAIKITAAVLVVLIALLGVLVGVGQALNKQDNSDQQGTEAVKEEAPPVSSAQQQSGAAVQEAPPGGGTSEKAQVTDSVEYTIRDAKGKVKDHKVIGR